MEYIPRQLLTLQRMSVYNALSKLELLYRSASIMLKNAYYAFRNFPKIFPIMPKYQPIVLKIMLAYFSYCIRLPSKFES